MRRMYVTGERDEVHGVAKTRERGEMMFFLVAANERDECHLVLLGQMAQDVMVSYLAAGVEWVWQNLGEKKYFHLSLPTHFAKPNNRIARHPASPHVAPDG